MLANKKPGNRPAPNHNFNIKNPKSKFRNPISIKDFPLLPVLVQWPQIGL